MTPRTSNDRPVCRLGLIGDHPWARALLEAAQLQGGLLAACAGPQELTSWAVRLAPDVVIGREAHTVLAHPEVDIIVLADVLPYRGDLLLEAVQLERAVLVLHPADLQVERYYIVQLALQERRFPVWPLMPHRFFAGLAQVFGSLRQAGDRGAWQLEAHVAIADKSHPANAAATANSATGILQVHPLWFWADWLRWLGGEVAEVYVIAERTKLSTPDTPLTLTGRWQSGGQFVVRFAPDVAEGFHLQTPQGVLRWEGSTIAPGKHQWHWQGATQQQSLGGSNGSVWEAYANWLLQMGPAQGEPPQWSDAVAAAEIVQAAEESLRSRQAVTLLHQEYTESAVFKSRATTLGCGLVWLMLGLVMVSPLLPQALYLVPVLLVLCLALFAIGWVALRR